MPPASQPTVNPYTGRGYSQKYFDILAKRKGKTVIHMVESSSPNCCLLICWGTSAALLAAAAAVTTSPVQSMQLVLAAATSSCSMPMTQAVSVATS